MREGEGIVPTAHLLLLSCSVLLQANFSHEVNPRETKHNGRASCSAVSNSQDRHRTKLSKTQYAQKALYFTLQPRAHYKFLHQIDVRGYKHANTDPNLSIQDQCELSGPTLTISLCFRDFSFSVSLQTLFAFLTLSFHFAFAPCKRRVRMTEA